MHYFTKPKHTFLSVAQEIGNGLQNEEINLNDRQFLDAEEIIAFIGKGTEFKGVLSYEGTVRIDGKIEGEIITKGTLVVGESAIINAEAAVGTLICGGKITGNINSKNKVHLLAPGIIVGTIKTPVLIIEEGVRFNGKCVMLAKEEKKVSQITPEKDIKIAGVKGAE